MRIYRAEYQRRSAAMVDERIEIHPRKCIAVRKHRNTPRVITSRQEGGSDRQGQRVQTQGSIVRGGIAYLELAGCAAR